MSVKTLDVVRLKDDREVTILEIYDQGTAFLVEETDDSGKTIDTPVIKKEDIAEVLFSS